MARMHVHSIESLLSVNNPSLQYGSCVFFDKVKLKFTRGNCYIAKGAGKSILPRTFLEIWMPFVPRLRLDN